MSAVVEVMLCYAMLCYGMVWYASTSFYARVVMFLQFSLSREVSLWGRMFEPSPVCACACVCFTWGVGGNEIR